MRRAYLLAYSVTLGTREQVKAALNAIPEIIHWRTDLPNAIYLISETESARELSEKIREQRGGKGRFFLTEISSNKGGWLTPESWHLINYKKHKPKA